MSEETPSTKVATRHARQRRRLAWAGTLTVACACLCYSVHGSSSGLNNTPTADTCPVRTVVVQGWTGFAHDVEPDWWTGLKLGVVKGLEVGADWDANGDPSRHVQFQAKYGYDINDVGTRIAIGVANLSDNTRRTRSS
jgi:hypothetical protein